MLTELVPKYFCPNSSSESNFVVVFILAVPIPLFWQKLIEQNIGKPIPGGLTKKKVTWTKKPI